jgi:hypothetical protein
VIVGPWQSLRTDINYGISISIENRSGETKEIDITVKDVSQLKAAIIEARG